MNDMNPYRKPDPPSEEVLDESTKPSWLKRVWRRVKRSAAAHLTLGLSLLAGVLVSCQKIGALIITWTDHKPESALDKFVGAPLMGVLTLVSLTILAYGACIVLGFCQAIGEGIFARFFGD